VTKKTFFSLLRPSFFFVGFLILLDQWAKITIRSMILYQSINVLPFLRFNGTWNPGISFGLFPCSTYTSRALLSILSLIVIIYLIKEYLRSSGKLIRISLLLIIAGACGNFLDRIIHGKVFDFINIYYSSWNFPIFNLADAFISAGCLFFIVDTLRRSRETPLQKP
jgi:signal peptidase II